MIRQALEHTGKIRHIQHAMDASQAVHASSKVGGGKKYFERVWLDAITKMIHR